MINIYAAFVSNGATNIFSKIRKESFTTTILVISARFFAISAQAYFHSCLIITPLAFLKTPSESLVLNTRISHGSLHQKK
jgi:hypothetical protein